MVRSFTEQVVGEAVGGAISGCFGKILFYAVLIALVVVLIKGFYRIPLGARGVVIWMGRRTGEVRGEGITWMPPVLGKIVSLYVRERQIDIPDAAYHTADRARISFKTTVRVVVDDPAALLEQGPGTYGPFLRDGHSSPDWGAEEYNIALYRLMQNSIREAVSSLTIHDVMFGGPGTSQIQRRILDQLSRTTQRWGLGVREVWLTEVKADDDELQRAVQAEVRESMEGRGKLAAHEAEVAKGTLFEKVAAEMVREMAAQGRQVSLQDAVSFLRASYQDERGLEVALKRAENVATFAHEWTLQSQPAGSTPGFTPQLAAPQPRRLAGNGPVLILGREGQIQVDGDGVSRHHAQIEMRGTQLLVTDLGSLNGTYVGGEKLPANVPTAVTPGSRVRLGKHVTVTGQELMDAMRGEQGGQLG